MTLNAVIDDSSVMQDLNKDVNTTTESNLTRLLASQEQNSHNSNLKDDNISPDTRQEIVNIQTLEKRRKQTLFASL